MKTLYVSNLPWTADEIALAKHFEKFAAQNCRVIRDRLTGKSRGFGFVDVDDADMDAAITAYNGSEMDGRELIVNEARPKDATVGPYRSSYTANNRAVGITWPK